MAENQAATPAQEQEEFTYPVKVEDVAPGTKKITVEIPQERISAELEKQFKELRGKAALPGFRPGRAPRKLVEKRFATDVREDVRRQLLSESYQQALEKNQLNVVGEPEFDNPDSIKLPDQGALSFSFQVEVAPEFELPALEGIAVKKPKVEVTEKHVDEAMKNLTQQQGTLIPVEDRGMAAEDYVTADVVGTVEGQEMFKQPAYISPKLTALGGFRIEDLHKQLEGAKAGETRTVTSTVPDTYPDQALRGKQIAINVTIKDIKRLEPAEITPEFLSDLGFANEQELRDALREQMVERITADVQQNMRSQVAKHLLDNVKLDLPTKMSERQTERVVRRRALRLLNSGISGEQIGANVDKLRTGAAEEAAGELKMLFILQKIADQQDIDVSEGELNSRIALMAAHTDKRPEKLKQELSKDGRLSEVYLQLREEKVLDKLIEKAKIEDVDLPEAAK